MERSDEASEIVRYWRDAGPAEWFGKRRAFDDELRRRFLHVHEEAARGRLRAWTEDAEGALALLILLDQFPRNAFRGTPRMYATDPLARACASRAIDLGLDAQADDELRLFFYLPFAHSEVLADQERSVRLHERIGYAGNARRHHDIIRRFGRFPHRNEILGRPTSAREQAFLDAGGFAG